MSTEPADELLERAAESATWAAAIEDHLDAHPLPVEPDEIERIAARVHARIQRRRRSVNPWIALGGIVLAAAAAVALWMPATETPPQSAPETVAAPAVVFTPVQVLEGPLLEREALVLGPDARVLRSEQGPTTVLLVQQGTVLTPTQAAPAGNWVLSTEANGVLEQVVFPDGQAPPPLNGDVWPDSVHTQLRAVRWSALPPETLAALDALLEAP